MTYASMAQLSDDPEFANRVTACCQEQALVFKDDGRADIATLAKQIIASPTYARGIVELVCVSPGIKDVATQSAVDDATILSAVQANWPVYAGVMFPPPPEPVQEPPA